MTQRVDKDSLPLNQPRRTPSHPTKSHIVKTKVDGKEKILRFGEQGASTAGKPKAGESERMKAKRASFKARHGKNIAKGQSSPAYWANKVKWADGGAVNTYGGGGLIDTAIQRGAEALGFDSERQIAISKEAADLTNQMADAGLIEDQYRVQLLIPEDVTKRTRLNTGIKGDEEVFNAVNHALFAYDAGQSTLGKIGAQAKEVYQGLNKKMGGGDPRSEYLDYFNNKFGFNLAEQGLSREEAKRAIMSNLGNLDEQGTRGRLVRGEEIKGGTDLLTNAQDAKYPWENFANGGEVSLNQLGDKYLPPEVMERMEVLGRQPSAVERATYDQFGMEPGVSNRPGIIPIREDGEWTMPGWMYDAGKAFVSPGTAMRGQQVSPEDVLNTAMTFTGGSLGASQAAGPAAEAGTQMLGMAVKNKGGNWMPGAAPENALEGLMTPTIVGDTPAQRTLKLEKLLKEEPSLSDFQTDMLNRHLVQYKTEASVDNWISNNLTKYMRNEMATPDDPIRVMAAQWPAQQSERLAAQQAKIDALVAKVENYRTGPLPEGVRDPAAWRATRIGTTQLELDDAIKALDTLGYREPLHYTPSQYEMNNDPYSWKQIARRNAGFPEGGVSPRGSAERWWENAADFNIDPRKAADILDDEAPLSTELPSWMFKIPPETPVYSMHYRENAPENLKFDHLIDELRNSTNLETDLPPALRLDPAKLEKITVPQMVEHVANINAYRAEQAAAANFARSNNTAVQVVKDYPDTNLGWRQIRMPEGETDTTALQEALKYEGDAMGHSVGGYARKGGYGHGGLDAILDGRAQVFSLRDARGQPHVTIEIGKAELKLDDLLKHLGGDEDLVETFMIRGHQARNAAGDSDTKSPLGHALELAGVPERYQITQVKGKSNGMPAEKYLPAIQDFIRSGNYEVTRDLQNTGLADVKEVYYKNEIDLLNRAGVNVPNYLTSEQIKEFDKLIKFNTPGLAAGGSVNLEQLAARYADGGDVDNWLEKAMSLDTPEMTLGETAADIAAGFAPGVGSAMSLRDFERARRDNDYLGMALSGIGVIPVVGGVARGVNKARKAGLDELYQAYTAADRANAGRRAAELISSQEPVKASEALGQLMERGFRNTTTTQSDRTRVGGGNIGGANFSAISEVDPGYAGKVWGVMNESVASRLTNLTTPETAWTPMLGSATQLKSNPIVFDKLKRAFVDSMKKGNLSDELAAKINHNLALDFGEGVDIRDPKIWQLADTFDKRGALADAMMGQGIAPKKGGVALGGELRGGAIFNPSQILIRETERALLHPMHGGDVPTFAAGPRAFSLDKMTEYRPDLHPGFPTLLHGKDLGVNMIPTPTEVYLPDWHRNFKAANPSRKPSHYDLALGVKHQGLPSQALNDDYIRHLIREGFAEGGEVSLDELNDKYLPPMSSAELLAQIDRSMANSPAPATGTASSAPDREVTESRNMLERFTSLDTPQDMSLGETAADIAMGFAPGIGTAQGLRDFERARRDDDTLGMVLGAASALPIVGGAVKAARTVGKAGIDLSQIRVRPPSDNITNVRDANFQYPKTIGNQTLDIDSITGGVRIDQQEQTRINRLANQIASPEGYISRIIVDQNNNVIEGQHRLEALRQLGAKEVPVYKIEELADTMPTGKMEEAINNAGIIHPDHVNQIMQYALENIAEQGVKGARDFDFGNFQKYYDAALNAIEAGGTAGKGVKAAAIPPLQNSQRTQLGSSTLPSYEKAKELLSNKERILDFGAGRGQGASLIGADTFEPYPREGFSPNFSNVADIPDGSYDGVTSLNVLNVLPREVRDAAVRNIGRVLMEDGEAVITTRGRDVMTSNGVDGPEPMSRITTADTYQKGFTQPELSKYVSSILGDGFTVSNLPQKIGAAGVLVKKMPLSQLESTLDMSQGGTVRAYDPLQIENIMSSINAPRNYASGGSVLAYNPGRVDAILNQFRGAV